MPVEALLTLAPTYSSQWMAALVAALPQIIIDLPIFTLIYDLWSQRPLPDNTQPSQQTNIHAPSGIRTHNLSRRAAKDLRLRPRGHWDRQQQDTICCKYLSLTLLMMGKILPETC